MDVAHLACAQDELLSLLAIAFAEGVLAREVCNIHTLQYVVAGAELDRMKK